MAPLLADMLKEWRNVTCYRSDNDWVFAKQESQGEASHLGTEHDAKTDLFQKSLELDSAGPVNA